jgi:predicted ribonuclease toxin of YeeF-YezG toxin-antitoxin module
MDIKSELGEAKRKRQEIVERINHLDQERQSLLQAVLREDGKVELLTKLIEEEGARKAEP